MDQVVLYSGLLQVVLEEDFLASQILDLVVQLIESLVLDAFLILEVIEGAWDKVVEDGLRLIDHVLVEAMLLVQPEEMHV